MSFGGGEGGGIKGVFEHVALVQRNKDLRARLIAEGQITEPQTKTSTATRRQRRRNPPILGPNTV